MLSNKLFKTCRRVFHFLGDWVRFQGIINYSRSRVMTRKDWKKVGQTVTLHIHLCTWTWRLRSALYNDMIVSRLIPENPRGILSSASVNEPLFYMWYTFMQLTSVDLCEEVDLFQAILTLNWYLHQSDPELFNFSTGERSLWKNIICKNGGILTERI